MPLITAKNQTVRFEVTKVTSGIQFCPTCLGTGTMHERAYHNRTIGQKCTTCGGKGKTKVTHQTTVSLKEALKELDVLK